MRHFDELVFILSRLCGLSLTLFFALLLLASLASLAARRLRGVLRGLMSAGVEADIRVFKHGGKPDLLPLYHLQLVVGELREHVRQQFVVRFE